MLIHVEAAHNICHYSNLTVVAAKEAKKIDYLVSGKIVQMTSLYKKGEITVRGKCLAHVETEEEDGVQTTHTDTDIKSFLSVNCRQQEGNVSFP